MPANTQKPASTAMYLTSASARSYRRNSPHIYPLDWRPGGKKQGPKGHPVTAPNSTAATNPAEVPRVYLLVLDRSLHQRDRIGHRLRDSVDLANRPRDDCRSTPSTATPPSNPHHGPSRAPGSSGMRAISGSRNACQQGTLSNSGGCGWGYFPTFPANQPGSPD